MRVLDGDTVVRRVPLIVTEDVAEGGFYAKIRDTIALALR
jgi:hypothetical protein